MEEIEHHITYPEPSSSKNEGDLSDVINEDHPPVVLVFGWGGCLDKNLAKYSQLYDQKGFVTSRYTAPIKIVFWSRAELKNIGERIVKDLEEAKLDDRLVFVHCMSNAGAFLYSTFSSALDRLSKPIKIKGVIFDSCPGGPNVLSFYRAISAIVGGNILYNWPVSTIITVVILMFWYYDIFKQSIFPSANFDVDPFRYLRRQRNISPQFLIYSMDDNLIFYNEVEEFISIRKNIGVDVSAVCIKNSPHVRHYATHKEEYVKGVCDFIRKCLTQE